MYMNIKDRNTCVEKQDKQDCLREDSRCKKHILADVNGCVIKFTFGNGDDEKSLQGTLDDLRSNYIGKSIMR